MRIGYSQLDSDREFDNRHDKQDLKIGETKFTAYPIGKAWDCPIFCRMDQEFLLEISHLGIVDLFLFQMMCFAPAVTISQIIITCLKF